MDAAPPAAGEVDALAHDTVTVDMNVEARRGQVFAPGIHLLRVRVPDRLGGGVVIVRFKAGFDPDTWWAGPDPSRWPLSTDGEGGRSVVVVDWSRFETLPPWPPDGRAYFGPDSFRFIPVARRPVGNDIVRRTFYEIYGNRIYARSEGDTVHLGAWVVFCNGGHDRDSPYVPKVDPSDPALPSGFLDDPVSFAVLHDLGLVGSPIAFRSRITTRLPSGVLAAAPASVPYPDFEPNSVFRLPAVMGYQAVLRGQGLCGRVSPELQRRPRRRRHLRRCGRHRRSCGRGKRLARRSTRAPQDPRLLRQGGAGAADGRLGIAPLSRIRPRHSRPNWFSSGATWPITRRRLAGNPAPRGSSFRRTSS